MSDRRSRLSGARKQLTALVRRGGNEDVSLSTADTAPRVNCFEQCCRATTQPSITLSSTTRKEAVLAEGDFVPHFYQTNPFSKVFSRDRGYYALGQRF